MTSSPPPSSDPSPAARDAGGPPPPQQQQLPPQQQRRQQMQQLATEEGVKARAEELKGKQATAKNVGEGFAKGVAIAGRGVFEGLGSLVTAPIQGAKDDGGVAGFFKGTAVGLKGFVLLPALGIAHGAKEIGTGFKNDSVARMMNKDKGETAAEAEGVEVVLEDVEVDELNERSYSDSRQAVQRYALADDNSTSSSNASSVNRPQGDGASSEGEGLVGGAEAGAAAAVEGGVVEAAEAGAAAGGEMKRVKEIELYDALQVDPSCTPAELRAAFFKVTEANKPRARHLGNPSEAEAKAEAEKRERFNAACSAYMVLMDPDKRAAYDKFGLLHVLDKKAPTIDHGLFYTIAFGAEKFKPLIGELTVAYTAAVNTTPQLLPAWQQQREDDLALLLLERLQPWLAGEEQRFVETAVALAEDLKGETFGLPMLHVVGYTYYHTAEVCLGLEHFLGIPGYIPAIRQIVHQEKSVEKAGDAAEDVERMKHTIDVKGTTVTTDLLPDFLEALWLINALDIESTLRKVVETVVKDKSVDKDVRKRRATGVMRLGKVFMEA